MSVLIVALCHSAYATDEVIPSYRIAILVSLKIRPYLEALEGMENSIGIIKTMEKDVFFLDDIGEDNLEAFGQKLKKMSFDCFISVGPEATKFTWQTFPDDAVTKLFTMVLNPDNIIQSLTSFCGVSLNIPIATQVRLISGILPGVKTIGLLFDRMQNAEFFNTASASATALGLIIKPMEVSTPKELSSVLSKHWAHIDLLWLIPDHTVITESLVRFMIKEAISNEIPVAGYNSFFYQSGAGIAFVTDYTETGRKTIVVLQDILSGVPCNVNEPFFETWVNERVLKKLNKPFIEHADEGVRGGP